MNSTRIALVVLASTVAASVHAADLAAGQAKVAQQCAECHRPKDWNGETTAALQSLIADIVAGKVRHPRELKLTPEEIANIAAYYTSKNK